jgi:hypothetical protein
MRDREDIISLLQSPTNGFGSTNRTAKTVSLPRSEKFGMNMGHGIGASLLGLVWD